MAELLWSIALLIFFAWLIRLGYTKNKERRQYESADGEEFELVNQVLGHNEADTEEAYRRHLAELISRTKSRGGTRYFNQYVNRCRIEAATAYPKGAASAQKTDTKGAGLIGALAALLAIFG